MRNYIKGFKYGAKICRTDSKNSQIVYKFILFIAIID